MRPWVRLNMLIPSFTQLCVTHADNYIIMGYMYSTGTLLSTCVSCVPWWWQWLSGARLLPSTPRCSDTLPPHIPTKGWDGTVTDTGNLLYDRQTDANAICLLSKKSRKKYRNKQSNLNLTANTQFNTAIYASLLYAAYSYWHRESSFFINRWTQTPYVLRLVSSVRKAERSLGTSKTAWTLLLTPSFYASLLYAAYCMKL